MDPIRRILVIVDPTSHAHPCVGKAALLAAQFGAEVELFACDTKASRAARMALHLKERPAVAFESSLLPLLETIAAPLRASGLKVDVSTQTLVSALYTTLLKKTKNALADLVVKDTHHHSIARRTFLTNTDWQLIRHCPVPLLLAKPRPWAKLPHIVAAIDPEQVNDKPRALDQRILEYASVVAESLGGALHVAHACLPEAVVKSELVDEPDVVDLAARRAIQAQVERQRCGIASLLEAERISNATIHVKLNTAIDLLTELAESLPADVTVMGAISRSTFDRVLLGSTAEDILEGLPSDALIVKSPDFGDALPF